MCGHGDDQCQVRKEVEYVEDASARARANKVVDALEGGCVWGTVKAA